MIDSSGKTEKSYKHSFHLIVLPELLCAASARETRLIYDEVMKRLDNWYSHNRVVDCIYKSVYMLRTVMSTKNGRNASINFYKGVTDAYQLFLYSCVTHVNSNMIRLQSDGVTP